MSTDRRHFVIAWCWLVLLALYGLDITLLWGPIDPTVPFGHWTELGGGLLYLISWASIATRKSWWQHLVLAIGVLVWAKLWWLTRLVAPGASVTNFDLLEGPTRTVARILLRAWPVGISAAGTIIHGIKAEATGHVR